MASDSAALRALARDLGIGTDFWGWDGVQRQVADSTLLSVLAALGRPVESDDDIARLRREHEDAPWRRTLPPVVVTREDRAVTVPVHVEHGSWVRVRVELEDGTARDLSQGEDNSAPREIDGVLRGRARFWVPEHLPLGWHRLVASTDAGDAACDLVVTPARVTVQDRLGARRAFGIQAQLYSVRSDRSWGIGDLKDAADLAAILGARDGADFLLVNPLHASHPQPPVEPSPYLPVTRRFANPIYLRIEDIPEYATAPGSVRTRIARQLASVAELDRRADRLERDRVLAAKNVALEDLFALPRPAGRQALFDAYRAREGAAASSSAHHSAKSASPAQRSALADRTSPSVEQARTELAGRVEFHAWVQWQLDAQMSAAQTAALDAGMRIGMMHDLAVGVDHHGSDAWSLASTYAQGVSVGAPADQYNQQGQNWAQPPWRPDRLAETGYRPWRDMLRSLMRHTGALRIDHVLGLFRLWWIPEGASAADGAYVFYDHEAMIGILALEAQRSGTIIIGEDLGTFEPWVRDYLSDRGILGTSILWFEYDHDGAPLPPEHYRRLCLASVNTHDLPPTSGYLAGDHVALRERLGLLERPLEEELATDRAARERLLDILRREGLLEADADVEDTIIALHRHLALAPSLLLGVSLVDCVGERRIQNQPGTDEEYPNWRIPLADDAGRVVTVDDLGSDARTRRLLRAVREALRG